MDGTPRCLLSCYIKKKSTVQTPRIIRLIGLLCKMYLEVVRGRGEQCIPKQPCPYCNTAADCLEESVLYWGWFERKEGSIPYGDGTDTRAIPIRRFKCKDCKHTYSWRPPFLVRWRRFAAITYEQMFKDWVLERPSGPRQWYQPDVGVRKALGRQWNSRVESFFDRCGTRTPCVSRCRQIRRAIRTAARALVPAHEKLRFSSHYLLIVSTPHPFDAQYSLAAT